MDRNLVVFPSAGVLKWKQTNSSCGRKLPRPASSDLVIKFHESRQLERQMIMMTPPLSARRRFLAVRQLPLSTQDIAGSQHCHYVGLESDERDGPLFTTRLRLHLGDL